MSVNVAVPNEAAAQRLNNHAETSLFCNGGAAISGRAWIDASNDAIYQTGEETLAGWRVQLLRGGKVVKEASTDPAGQYTISGVTPERGYSLRFLSPQGRIEAPPLDSKDGSALVIKAHRNFADGTLVYDESLAPREYPHQDLALLPTGIIFNAETAEPLINAKVTLLGPPGFMPSRHLVGPDSNVITMTDEKGRYNFFLTPDAPAGLYHWQVVAAGFEKPADNAVLRLRRSLAPTGPDQIRLAYKVFDTPFIPSFSNENSSAVEAPAVLSASGDRHGSTTEKPAIDHLSEDQTERNNGYFAMMRVKGAMKVVNNHLGMHPLLAGGELSLEKTADRKSVEMIDLFHYTLKVSHRRAAAFAGFIIDDSLPRGLRYVPGSARLTDGKEVGVLPDPIVTQGFGGGVTGLRFDFSGTELRPNTPMEISYRVAVGATVSEGAQLISYATVTAGTASAQASATIRITGGVFSNDAFVLGKVFLDCNGDRQQNRDEIGVPGVRIYLEDGAFAETDRNGNYSLYGLKPLTHVLKMDPMTLPSSARAVVLSNRAAGRGDLRFLDLRNGELGRGDFALLCNDGVVAEVAYRRKQLIGAGDEMDAALKLRFDAEVTPLEQRQAIQGDLAAGWVGEGRPSMPKRHLFQH